MAFISRGFRGRRPDVDESGHAPPEQWTFGITGETNTPLLLPVHGGSAVAAARTPPP